MKLRKKMMAIFSACVLTVCFMGMQVSAANLTTAQIVAIKNEDSGTIHPRQDKIGWLYKSENGRMYRRLFNYSKNEWIGDWEIC